MQGSLRKKLLAGFLTFSIISLIIIVPSSNYYFDKKENISNIIHKTDLINKHILQDFRVLTDFFRFEITNPQFFTEQYSPYLEKHARYVSKISAEMDSLLKEEDLHYLDIKQELTLLQTSYNEYLQTLNEIVQLLLERGFKDYGTVGVMRNYIHQLEKYEDIDQTQVLSLRRHEKDYIIRHQEQYIQKLNKRAGDFKNQIKRNNQLTTHERKKAVAILDKYVENFNKMVKYEKQIGMYTNSGLKKELDMQERQIEKQFGLLIGKASERKSDLYTRLKYYYILFFLILISLIVLASTFTSKLITKPLISLSSYISAFVENGFYHPHELKIPNQKDEIASLYKEFDNLIK